MLLSWSLLNETIFGLSKHRKIGKHSIKIVYIKVTLDDEGIFWEIGLCAPNFSAIFSQIFSQAESQIIVDSENMNLVSIYFTRFPFITTSGKHKK